MKSNRPSFRIIRIMVILLCTMIVAISCDEHVSPGEPPEKLQTAPLETYTGPAIGGDSDLYEPSVGQTIYVPVYSSIYDRTEKIWINLTTTVSIRNTDPDHSVIIELVEYHGSGGELIQSYVEKPVVLKPMGSTEFIIREKDTRGGAGANFIVKWFSEQPVSPILTEAVMISTAHNQGISFVSHGIITHETKIGEED